MNLTKSQKSGTIHRSSDGRETRVNGPSKGVFDNGERRRGHDQSPVSRRFGALRRVGDLRRPARNHGPSRQRDLHGPAGPRELQGQPRVGFGELHRRTEPGRAHRPLTHTSGPPLLKRAANRQAHTNEAPDVLPSIFRSTPKGYFSFSIISCLTPLAYPTSIKKDPFPAIGRAHFHTTFIWLW